MNRNYSCSPIPLFPRPMTSVNVRPRRRTLQSGLPSTRLPGAAPAQQPAAFPTALALRQGSGAGVRGRGSGSGTETDPRKAPTGRETTRLSRQFGKTGKPPPGAGLDPRRRPASCGGDRVAHPPRGLLPAASIWLLKRIIDIVAAATTAHPRPRVPGARAYGRTADLTRRI